MDIWWLFTGQTGDLLESLGVVSVSCPTNTESVLRVLRQVYLSINLICKQVLIDNVGKNENLRFTRFQIHLKNFFWRGTC